MRITPLVVTFLAACGLLLNTGCPTADSVTSEIEGTLTQSDKSRDLAPKVTSDDLAELVAGNAEFALDLYGVLGQKDENLFFSPYSISAALAMTYAGARGQTESQWWIPSISRCRRTGFTRPSMRSIWPWPNGRRALTKAVFSSL